MKIKQLLLVGAVSLGFVTSSYGTANSGSNSQTKSLYNWIKGFGGNFNRVLSGQQCVPNSIEYLGNFNMLYWGLGGVSYQYPALIGGDLGEHGSNETNELVGTLDWMATNEGSIISLSWHADNPITGGNMRDRSDIEMNKILPGGSKRTQWLNQLDGIANYLGWLEGQGHPVLWRPLHEMNGNWFWWGKQGSASKFKELWRDMFNYFTYTKGLDNLIWVYSPNNKTWSGIADYDTYYPGSGYVDIVAADVYANNAIIIDNSRLRNKEKPIFYGEFGPESNDGSYTYWDLIYQIENNHPWVKAWLSWHDWFNGGSWSNWYSRTGWSYKSIVGNQHQWLQYHDWVINRDEINY